MTHTTKPYGLIAPWAVTGNLGNDVIGDSVHHQLATVGVHPIREFAMHRRSSMRLLARGLPKVGRIIVGGSSSLNPRMERWWVFWITPDLAALYRHRLTLMGVGWARYGEESSAYTKWVLGQVLDPDAVHSVRDTYTAERLADLGIDCLVTNCPTLWDNPAWRASEAATPTRVVLTVTDYNQDPARDRRWIDLVRQTGAAITFQPMSAEDVAYLTEGLGVDPTEIAITRLSALDEVLREPGTVIVGTRLHAGIRGIQHGRPAAIFAVDNRAIEMAKDAQLPVYDFDDVDAWLPTATGGTTADPVSPLAPPTLEAIQSFLGQFTQR